MDLAVVTDDHSRRQHVDAGVGSHGHPVAANDAIPPRSGTLDCLGGPGSRDPDLRRTVTRQLASGLNSCRGGP
jgi:hypothetical protein